MSETSRPAFSKGVLDLAERFQRAVGHTELGSKVVRAFTGSTSIAYRQLDWFSAGVTSETRGVVVAPGDPPAGRLARNWNTAVIMACELEEIKEYEQEPDAKEAVAYISEDVVHVGTRPIDHYMFKQIEPGKAAMAMRVGRAPLQAMMGVYVPGERHFIGAGSTEVIDRVPVLHDLTINYPGVLLG